MKHRIIKDVFTIIFKGNQRVGLEVDGLEKYIYLSPANVLQSTGIFINEIELLIGSKIRPEFYTEGEIMINGKTCEQNFQIIKDFYIEYIDSVEELRTRNKDKLKPLKQIQKVFQFHRNEKVIVGFDTGSEKATFIEAIRLQNLTLLEPGEFRILEGSYINPTYYEEGEEIFDGILCKKSGVILKALNLRYFGKIEEMHERFVNSEHTYSSGNYRSFNYDNSYESGNWLEDAAGSNDPEMMNDVYWNTD